MTDRSQIFRVQYSITVKSDSNARHALTELARAFTAADKQSAESLDVYADLINDGHIAW